MVSSRLFATAIFLVLMGAYPVAGQREPSHGPPRILEVAFAPNPEPRAPLVLLVTARTDRPTRARVLLDDGWEALVIEPPGEATTEHDLVVLGAHPDRRYAARLEVEDAEGRTATSEPWPWSTTPLPEGFPPLHVTVSRPELMEPGVTLIPAVRWEAVGAPHQDFGVLVALDALGEVVWFYEAPWPISEAKRLRNGHLLAYHGTLGDIVEMDMTGAVVRRWSTTRLPGKVLPEGAIPVDAGTIHHEVTELPDGDLLALSTELRRFDAWYTSERDRFAPRGPTWLVGDVVLRIARDGTVTERIPLLDVLDPYRIGYESLDPGFWRDVYTSPEGEPLADWSHANSIDHDPRDDSIVVSCYHLDTVFKYSLARRELVWLLSFPDGWDHPWREKLLTPVGDGLYPFHQHAARWTPQGTLLMFDNGKFRARPFVEPMPPAESFSRAVEFAVDEEARTFRQVWSYGGRPGEVFFTAFLGETDWLPEREHVLITDGGRIRRPDGSFGIHPNQGQKWARVLEVTHETPARVVFEVVLDDPRWGWTVYRSERLPSLYPARGEDR